jgi:mannose-1-phosphate guanylyltransferase / phosphomannomutase
VNVEDIELATVPLTRFQVRNSGASAGFTVRLAPDDIDSVEIRFFDADGVDIDANMQRKVERLLSREDFRRAFAGDIGDIVFPPRSIEFYTAALERSVNAPRLRERSLKVVLDYSYGAASIVMPSVLAKLGAEVLAVNPFASTVHTAQGNPDEQCARIASLVRASGSELGFVMDPDGERAIIIDDEGHVLTADEALLAMVLLVAEQVPGARIALPVSVTREAERIATARGAEIVWTKIADGSLMEVAAYEGITLAAAPDAGFIWPEFLPAFDALATLAKLLDLLAASQRRLSDVVRGLPVVHIAHETVPTPWERKGAVMRELVERIPPDSVVLIDGVKIQRDDGWVLVLPDPEDPATHVWAEADSEGTARQVAQEYARRIRQIVR